MITIMILSSDDDDDAKELQEEGRGRGGLSNLLHLAFARLFGLGWGVFLGQ